MFWHWLCRVLSRCHQDAGSFKVRPKEYWSDYFGKAGELIQKTCALLTPQAFAATFANKIVAIRTRDSAFRQTTQQWFDENAQHFNAKTSAQTIRACYEKMKDHAHRN